MTRVKVKPQLLRWARDRSGVPAETLRGSFPKLDLWEHERDQPTLKQRPWGLP
jgi:hypothetical protein